MQAIRTLRRKAVLMTSALILSAAASLPAGAQEPSFPDLSELQPDTVVAVVNNNPINFAQIEYAYSLLPGDFGSQPLATILPQVIQLVVEQRLLAEQAVIDELHTNVTYEAALQFQADRLLQEAYIDRMMSETITDEALEIAYTVFSTQLPLEDRIKARHILITPASNDVEDATAALQKAQGLIRQLNEGADFAELAAEFSDDEGSASQGGDLGFFPMGRMIEPFEEAAFALEPGSYTQEAVASPFGFHIIEVLEKTKMKPPLTEVRTSLTAQLEAQRLAIKLEELRGAADIKTIIETPDQ